MSSVLANALLSSVASSDGVAMLAPGGRSISYSELNEQSRSLAAGFIASGVRPGDRVAFQVHKSPSVVVLHLALLWCGAIQVPINPDYPAGEVRCLLEDAQPVAVIRDPDAPEIAGPWTSYTLDRHGDGSLLSLSDSADAPLPRITERDGAAILFTSGTTGAPKGALLSHGNLAHNASTLVDVWGFSSDDHLVHVLPLFHTHGLFVALHCALLSGACMSLLPRFDVDETIEALSDPRSTVMMGVPTHYARLVESSWLTADITAGMRLFISGSAPMTPALHQAFADRTGHQVLERYGMTETSMLTSNPVDGVRKPGSVGLPLPGVDVRVVAAADKEEREGDVGAVEVRGPNVFDGYWRRPELRDTAFTTDGWFRTGDLGRFDADGYLHLVGRSKDLVISGGLNVYPSDVEAVLDALPGVRESAVVGLPDADLGEQVVAVVVAETDDALDESSVRHLARQHLAGYQVPKRVIVMPELPRNVMGKVQKDVLRQALGTQ
ncbi:MAG TPA: AMP-binding protein [Actinomycetes bacterium]|nr:AMP-binding protein [Actinomycetes bacterium]